MAVKDINRKTELTLELPEKNPTHRFNNAIPREGENGVYSESWFPVCLSEELENGQLQGERFLDGKVVVYRGEDGIARVMSAYCPHVGADLSVGCVIENRLQCPFHKWEYDKQGACVKTAIGDPAPKTARLFKFPTVEHYGIIWAFNGNKPHWAMPEFSRPSENLSLRCYRFKDDLFQCDPWVFAANTPDMQHFKILHKMKFSTPDPHDKVNWDEWGFTYQMTAAHQQGVPIDWEVGIRGTSVFWQDGPYGDFWIGGMVGFGLPVSGKHEVFAILALDTNEVDKEKQDEQIAERFSIAENLMERTVGEDKGILNTMHYCPGTLTRSDQTLGRYLQFLRDYPRSHLSGPFII